RRRSRRRPRPATEDGAPRPTRTPARHAHHPRHHRASPPLAAQPAQPPRRRPRSRPMPRPRRSDRAPPRTHRRHRPHRTHRRTHRPPTPPRTRVTVHATRDTPPRRLHQAPPPPMPWNVTQLDIPSILNTPPPEHDWVWDQYIEVGTLTVIHGDGGTGKSILAGHLARAITTGGPCLGRPTQQGRVLILDAENPMDEIARRMHALDYAHTPPGSIAYYRAAEAVFGTTDSLDLEPLATLIELHRATTVILDSQRGLWGGDEKEQVEIRPLYRQLQ